jgi:hypothetical protein
MMESVSGQSKTRDAGVDGKPAKKKFIVGSIFMTHVRRIGFLRTFFGGFLQYLSVIEFVLLHLTVIIVLYRWMLTPFFRLKKFRIKDYMLLDRGKIEGMCAFDRFNCQFCGYANGTAKLWNDELDEMAKADLGKGNLLLAAVTLLYTLCLLVFLFFQFILSKVLFMLIALFLGLHWAKTGEIRAELKASDYAGSHRAPLKGILRFAKLYASSLALNLEQIESQWCPLKHIEREGAVVSEHHRNFYGQDEFGEALEALAKDGSVSPRKPRY